MFVRDSGNTGQQRKDAKALARSFDSSGQMELRTNQFPPKGSFLEGK